MPSSEKCVDAGHDWLIFALPPAEIAVHSNDDNVGHELYFMSDDLNVDMAALGDKDVQCSGARGKLGLGDQDPASEWGRSQSLLAGASIAVGADLATSSGVRP